VLDLDKVDRILDLFAHHLAGVRLFYSVKSNNDPTLLRYLVQQGLGLDVASPIELALALSVRAPLESVILSHPVKSPKCIRELFHRRVPLTTVDSEAGLKALALESTFSTFRPGILARVKVQSQDVEIDLNEKFGCSEDDAVRLLQLSQSLGLPSLGVHFHVGTQCWNVRNYELGLEAAIRVLERLAEIGIRLNTINIGGGFPDEIVMGKAGGIERFFADLGALVRRAQDRGYQIQAEPGRVISSGAGIAVSQVIGRNHHAGRDWIYLDDGVYGLFSTALFEKRGFELHPVGDTSGLPAKFIVGGPTCDSLDVIGRDIVLPADIKTGDYVMALHAGAYSVSVKSHFNGMAEISTTVMARAVVAIEEPGRIER
jgi:ornithine decarboxylase